MALVGVGVAENPVLPPQAGEMAVVLDDARADFAGFPRLVGKNEKLVTQDAIADETLPLFSHECDNRFEYWEGEEIHLADFGQKRIMPSPNHYFPIIQPIEMRKNPLGDAIQVGAVRVGGKKPRTQAAILQRKSMEEAKTIATGIKYGWVKKWSVS